MNFIIFLCVTLKLFSLSFVSLLAPNPGDATVYNILDKEDSKDGMTVWQLTVVRQQSNVL